MTLPVYRSDPSRLEFGVTFLERSWPVLPWTLDRLALRGPLAGYAER